MVSLSGRDLHCRFANGKTEINVLRGVTLDLSPGQFGLLMGRTGSGKTTLLSVMSGLLRPTAGSVRVRDRDGSLVDLWTMTDPQREQFRLRNFGFIFQGFNLFPSLTALEQLEMVLRWGENVSPREAHARADAMLSDLNLAPATRRQRPQQLSGGEKQRVAIGRALVKRPAFCFADEPTSALDDETGELVVGLLREMGRKHGTTLLVVSHDREIIPFADDVFYLRKGLLASPDPAAPHELEIAPCSLR
jgi:putative ABC transport system ATP-binding protein